MATEARSSQMDTGSPVMWIMVGINVSWITGLLGSFMDDGGDTQLILYSLAALGGMVGGLLLGVRHLRAGRDFAAAGFLGLGALAPMQTVAGFGEGGDYVFLSLSIMHLAAMLMIAVSGWAPTWARAAAALSGVAFAVYGYTRSLDDGIPDVDDPILTAAWILFVVSIIGWTLTLRSEE